MIRILAALLLLAAGALAHAESAMRIQFAEPVSMKATPGIVSFDAYGRRFELELTDNDRVTAKLSAQRKVELARYRILRGTLLGQSRSWVRLTEFNGRVEGAIWDGQELYAVTSLDRIAANLTTPLAGAPAQTVVFRLSDTLNAFPGNFCADTPPVPQTQSDNGLVQYRAMVSELAVRAASTPIPLQIEISLICDWTCQSRFAADTTGELLARHNVVDGIYAEQVGLLVIPAEVRHAPAAPDPFAATDPETLLDALSTFRRNNSTVAAFGLAHLVTGRDLVGDTVGIANINGVCDIDRGVSLTEASSVSSLDGLIMAHELGHNFGAIHDGSGACASTPQIYLMSPSLNFSAELSRCSLDTMRPIIEAAQCITPAAYADVELPDAAPTLSVENDVPLIVPYVVSSTGTQTARNASLEVNAPEDFTITGASGSNCTVAPDTVTCLLGDIPAGEHRTVNVTLLPSHIGQYNIHASVAADNNPSTHNDSQLQPVDVVMNADARVTMTASATTVLVDDPVDIRVVVESLRSHAVRGATVRFSNHILRGDSASVNGGSCNVGFVETVCTLDDIPGGTTRAITIRTTATTVGLAQLAVGVNPPVDADASNNFAHLEVRVNPVRDVGIEQVTPNIVANFGQPFEFDANVRSYGAQPINNVTLNISISTPQFADTGIDSVSVGGVTCTQPPGIGSYQCALGTLAAGESRPIAIRGHGASLGTYEFSLQVSGTGDQDRNNDSLRRGVTIRNAVDVAIPSPTPVTISEGLEGHGSVLAISNGTLAVPNAVFDVTAPASIRFTRVFVEAEKGTCSLVTEQHLRCSLSFGANPAYGAHTNITYFLIGTVPGSYNLTATIQTANDEVPANDSMPLPITVSPLVNAGVLDFTGPQYLMVGSDATITASVFTGSRPVPGATAIVRVLGGGAEISSMTTGAGSCTREGPAGFLCDFGALPAGASVPLSVVLHGTMPSPSLTFSINASAVGDNNLNDNIRSITFQVTGAGDVQISISGNNPAPAGVAFPVTVTLRRTGPLVDGHLQITIPAGVVLNSISAGVLICTGNSTLECDLNSWPEDQAFEIGLNLLLEAASTYVVSAKVSSANDTDASNNEASHIITVGATTPPPVISPPVTPPSNPPGGGGGGGGSIDLFMLVALATLLMFVYSARRRRAIMRA